MNASFDVIVPVKDEAVALEATAPALKRSLDGLCARVTFVLNGTTDQSAQVIGRTFGSSARVITLGSASKTAALNAADDEAGSGIRVYLDADVTVAPDIFHTLLAPLTDGSADLVSPRLRANLAQCGPIARRVGRVWADQLSRRPDAFMCCTAFSAAGVKARGPWPDVLADDDWARDQIRSSRRHVVEAADAVITPPRDLVSWLTVRGRWIRGRRELARLGSARTQSVSVAPRGTFADVSTYVAMRLAAEPVAVLQSWAGNGWGRDDSSRKS